MIGILINGPTMFTVQVRNQSVPSEQEIQRRQRLCTSLETYIRQSYPTARLEIFGSSANGFGTPQSDLDISMTFSDVSTTAGYHDGCFAIRF